MITTITPNPAIDRTIVVNGFAAGKLHRVQGHREDVGGKGINVSKVIKNLGGETTALGFIGGENGQKIRKFLELAEIGHDFVDTGENTRTNIKITDPVNGTSTEINETGKYIKEQYILELKHKVEEHARRSKFVVLSGSAPAGVRPEVYGEIVGTAGKYTRTALDADGEFLKRGVEASPFIIKPNISELKSFLGEGINTQKEIINASRYIIDRYGVKLVLVSLGEAGSILASKEEAYKAMPLKVEVKCTVGAGDSMLAGFLFKYAENESLTEALRFASACGTMAVMTDGTGGFATENLNSIIKNVEIIRLY